MTNPRLVFVRHGVASSVEGRCIGHTDVPLSAAGADSVRVLQLGEFKVSAIVCSDLRRARESADIIASSISLEPTNDARLREMNFGEWDGREWSELQRSDGDRLGRWMENWRHASPPAGESVDEIVGRVSECLRDIRERFQTDDNQEAQTVVVVAHAGSIRAALCLLREVPVDQMFDIDVPHATAIAFEPAAWPRALHSV